MARSTRRNGKTNKSFPWALDIGSWKPEISIRGPSNHVFPRKGSDLLLGNGDMLLRDYEKGITRGQYAFVSSGEIKQVCEIINTPLPSGHDQELFRISDSDLQS